MEYADDGDLWQKIELAKRTGSKFDEKLIWNVMLQTAAGLRELHRLGIAHRDIKPANIFLFKNGTIKIADMNVSKIMKRDPLKTQTGTPIYASPEVWNTSPYDLKSDVWSLGCVIYELVCLRPPFDGHSLDEVFDRVQQCMPQHIPKPYTEKLQTAIGKMLKRDPAQRISIGIHDLT